jgi:hypothetical protein
LGGGLLVLGYAAFNWLRAKRPQRKREQASGLAHQSPEPLAASSERVPDELALDLEAEQLPANSNASPQRAELGALFLGRASAALSAVHFGPDWPTNAR